MRFMQLKHAQESWQIHSVLAFPSETLKCKYSLLNIDTNVCPQLQNIETIILYHLEHADAFKMQKKREIESDRCMTRKEIDDL